MFTEKQLYDKQRYTTNRNEIKARTAKWQKENPEKYKKSVQKFFKRSPEKHREYQLKCRYNLTPEQFEAMLQKQDNRCAICKVKPDYMLSIDHNHKTQEVRGLLCQRCNIAVGFIEIEGLLDRVQAYLH